jgi:FdhD protein
MTSSGSWRSMLDPERVMQVDVRHWQGGESYQRAEQLAVEEPFEIRIEHRSLAVIMRTPGNDLELARGFLFSEGIIQRSSDILTLAYEQDVDGLPLPNVVNVVLRSTAAAVEPAHAGCGAPDTFARHFAVSSSCGLCGKDSIENAMRTTPPLESDAVRVRADVLYTLAQRLRGQQTVFSHTGGLHAAGLFSCAGDLLLLREDIGRHNAVDKLIGYGLLHTATEQTNRQPIEQAHRFPMYPYREYVLLVSGRTSFEIIQKALLARVPCVAAISAPSSLAVELADTGGITLVGFLRDTTMNVYTHPERIV